ncbi:MAG: CxxC-x17-CxxC domain-containing protein [Nanoarchaeota archaeon]
MGRFDGGNRGGFGGRPRGRDFNGGGFGGGFNRDRRPERRNTEMFDATCSTCGKACQVPFKPTGTKPVLCSQCFEKQGDRRSNFSSPGNSEDLKQINVKLDKIIAILKELELDVDEESEFVEPSNSDDSEDEEEI